MSEFLIFWTQIADLAIMLAYYSIPVMIILVALRHPGMQYSAHGKLFVYLFAVFIIFCGSTHLVDFIVFDWPIYRFSTAIRSVTAGLSVITAIYFSAKLPELINLQKRRLKLEQTIKNMQITIESKTATMESRLKDIKKALGNV